MSKNMDVDIENAAGVTVTENAIVASVVVQEGRSGEKRTDSEADEHEGRTEQPGGDNRVTRSTQTLGQVSVTSQGDVLVAHNVVYVQLNIYEDTVARLQDSRHDLEQLTDVTLSALARLDWNRERLLETAMTAFKLRAADQEVTYLRQRLTQLFRSEGVSQRVQDLAEDLLNDYQIRLHGLDVGSLVFLLEHSSQEDAEELMLGTSDDTLGRRRRLLKRMTLFLLEEGEVWEEGKGEQWWRAARWTVSRYCLSEADYRLHRGGGSGGYPLPSSTVPLTIRLIRGEEEAEKEEVVGVGVVSAAVQQQQQQPSAGSGVRQERGLVPTGEELALSQGTGEEAGFTSDSDSDHEEELQEKYFSRAHGIERLPLYIPPVTKPRSRFAEKVGFTSDSDSDHEEELQEKYFSRAHGIERLPLYIPPVTKPRSSFAEKVGFTSDSDSDHEEELQEKYFSRAHGIERLPLYIPPVTKPRSSFAEKVGFTSDSDSDHEEELQEKYFSRAHGIERLPLYIPPVTKPRSSFAEKVGFTSDSDSDHEEELRKFQEKYFSRAHGTEPHPRHIPPVTKLRSSFAKKVVVFHRAALAAAQDDLYDNDGDDVDLALVRMTEEERENARNEEIQSLCDVCGPDDGRRPLHVVLIGTQGVGKSSFINGIAASLSQERWHEYAYTGLFGEGIPVTIVTESYHKCCSAHLDRYRRVLLPTLTDVAGLPDEHDESLETLLRLLLLGCVEEYEPLMAVYQDCLTMTKEQLDLKYRTRQRPEAKADRVVFVATPLRPLPRRLMTCLQRVIRHRDLVGPQGDMLPVFGVMTHKDRIDVSSAAFQEQQREFERAMQTERLLVCTNYCDDVDQEGARVEHFRPDLDIPLLRFMQNLCRPLSSDISRGLQTQAVRIVPSVAEPPQELSPRRHDTSQRWTRLPSLYQSIEMPLLVCIAAFIPVFPLVAAVLLVAMAIFRQLVVPRLHRE
ncbi:uncharacterized protein LOC143286779 [Babylonia areolata]|uniref:uncharacterized protein LOC143286779 n=1 Tax=Babylonia areolata TaxID=304850 RepID=UPI003FD464B6